mgnify:CR=1 FL=1
MDSKKRDAMIGAELCPLALTLVSQRKELYIKFEELPVSRI